MTGRSGEVFERRANFLENPQQRWHRHSPGDRSPCSLNFPWPPARMWPTTECLTVLGRDDAMTPTSWNLTRRECLSAMASTAVAAIAGGALAEDRSNEKKSVGAVVTK